MMRGVVIYWETDAIGNLQSGFKKAFTFIPNAKVLDVYVDTDKFAEFIRKEMTKRGHDSMSLYSKRFYAYVVSGRPKIYRCLYPGYDKQGKIKKPIVKYGKVI